MDNRELERRLKTAVSHAAPDVKGRVLAACENEKGRVLPMTQAKKRKRFLPLIAAAAAVAVVLTCVAGFAIFSGGTGNTGTSIVMLDVNPSISLAVDGNELVTQVQALNKDAETVLGTMELTGVKLDVAVNALIGSMLQNGYLNDMQNSILISVQNGDAALKDKITGYIGGALGGDGYAILSQVVDDDGTLESMAQQYGISTGKAALIREVVAKDPTLTADTLAPLSVGEISLIANSRGLTIQGLAQSGEASTKPYITSDEAKAAALAHAGVSEQDAAYVEVKFDSEDGVMVYEVEFRAGAVEYEYDINAVSGEVVKVERDQNGQTSSGTGTQGSSTATVSEAAAKAAALQHAGVSESSISGYRSNLDRDDGLLKYEMVFYANGVKYEYEIDASAGTVLKAERSEQVSSGTPSQGSSTATVSEAAAKAAALQHAGVSESSISGYRMELDRDDGRLVYEIEFHVGRTEYDYEIDAASGTVLKADMDTDD